MLKIIKFISLFIVLIILLLIISNYIPFHTGYKEIRGKRWAREKIAVIYIDGIILGGKSRESFFSSKINTSDEILQIIKDIREDPTVKAVIIRLNSPGGSIAAAQEISDEIKRLRKQGRVVIASMSDIAASGAYYIAVSCDEIIANPGTLTGSIGVIMELGNLQELFKKIGIEFEVVKSGKYKDIGNPTRKLKKDERKILQDLLDDVHNQFITTVSHQRKIKLKKLKEIADGRVFTGKKAKELQLIDKLGNFEYAISRAKKLANIKGDVRVIEYEYRISPFDRFFGEVKLFLEKIIYFNKFQKEYATIR